MSCTGKTITTGRLCTEFLLSCREADTFQGVFDKMKEGEDFHKIIKCLQAFPHGHLTLSTDDLNHDLA
jgi:hypothetical protein